MRKIRINNDIVDIDEYEFIGIVDDNPGFLTLRSKFGNVTTYQLTPAVQRFHKWMLEQTSARFVEDDIRF